MAKILLVEDNEMNRDMLSRRLERKGYSVMLAIDGAEGVDKAKAEGPDVILMDMSLPVVDGWEATRRLKADEVTRRIPVVVLSADTESLRPTDQVRAVLEKPRGIPRLVEAVQAAEA